MDIVERLRDKWIKELTSCVSEKGLLFLDWYDAENLQDLIKAKDEEIERLREALADIANIVNPYEDGDTMQEIARAALKEKE